MLRHELNNPLTGILGNAELLLVEIRRKKDGKVPGDWEQRLETIATLAVRLRETVRRLSEEWEARKHPVNVSKKEVHLFAPAWAAGTGAGDFAYVSKRESTRRLNSSG